MATTAPVASAISCRDLTKRYGAVLALDHLSLDVPFGSIFGFLGPNGAGKTTALRLFTGLAFPDSGSATVAGIDVATGGVNLHRRMSFLDQSPQYYGWMRGRELLAFVGELFGLRGVELRSRVDEALALTGMTEQANRRIGGYSGGMRQRLGLAQALINRPEVLFLDEPASSLDPEGRHDMLEVIAGLRGQSTSSCRRMCWPMSSASATRSPSSIAAADRRLHGGRASGSLRATHLRRSSRNPARNEKVQRLIAALHAASWAGEVVQDHGSIRVLTRDPALASREILGLLAAQGVGCSGSSAGGPASKISSCGWWARIKEKATAN